MLSLTCLRICDNEEEITEPARSTSLLMKESSTSRLRPKVLPLELDSDDSTSGSKKSLSPFLLREISSRRLPLTMPLPTQTPGDSLNRANYHFASAGTKAKDVTTVLEQPGWIKAAETTSMRRTQGKPGCKRTLPKKEKRRYPTSPPTVRHHSAGTPVTPTAP